MIYIWYTGSCTNFAEAIHICCASVCFFFCFFLLFVSCATSVSVSYAVSGGDSFVLFLFRLRGGASTRLAATTLKTPKVHWRTIKTKKSRKRNETRESEKGKQKEHTTMQLKRNA